ncbi:MAG: hypothetical protein CMK32_03010 [Porticoccaceae bacterium]|nr:hypothetical protein [Porticoccaceae bacterium]|tara:strand:+ start:1619 stop:4192 length:2574 start_codon:yes stop_codon:yes gene_type:complete
MDRFCLWTALFASVAGTAVSAQPVTRDFNDDGTLDYPISITGYDETNPQGGASRLWSGASKLAIQTIVSPDSNTLFGYSSESAGDINGDGFDDVVVGEPLWGTADAWEGRVHVFSGQDGSSLLTIPGPYIELALGRFVAGIGDWNGDGTPDIASSAWVTVDTFGNGTTDDGYGIVFVFSGVDGSILAEITDATATEHFGFGVFGLGDINGDGRADIAITDPRADGLAGTSAEGQIYIYHGDATASSTFDFVDAAHTIGNGDTGLRTFAAQIDTMHPNRWLTNPTIQVLSLTTTDPEDGVTKSEFETDILELDGSFAGSKGTLPQLLDPGDIDMNGVVDTADVTASTGQYGTSPNATGVMPAADINKDGIVDATDIGQVLSNYGATTNIFEDLWEDNRLRSFGGRASGFGSHPSGLNIAPAGAIIRLDDCIFVSAGPDNSPSVIPYLLGLELRTNCSRCPGCDDLDPNECYECMTLGSLTGGNIDVDDPQPLPGETVIFTVQPIRQVGHKKKCVNCGSESRECNIHHDWEFAPWVIEVQDANGDWQPTQRGSASVVPDTKVIQVSVTGSSCENLRLRVNTSRSEPECNTITIDKNKSIKFASFEYTVLNLASTPANQSRTKVGVGEFSSITTTDPVTWDVTVTDESGFQTYHYPLSSYYPFQASSTAGTHEVIMTKNGCSRTVVFTIVEPNEIRFYPYSFAHIEDVPSSGFCADMRIYPIDVSFTGILHLEGNATYTLTGEFLEVHNATTNGDPVIHPRTNPPNLVGEDNWSLAVDSIYRALCADQANMYTPGYMSATIPNYYIIGFYESDSFFDVNTIGEINSVGTITVEKGDGLSYHEVGDIFDSCLGIPLMPICP